MGPKSTISQDRNRSALRARVFGHKIEIWRETGQRKKLYRLGTNADKQKLGLEGNWENTNWVEGSKPGIREIGKATVLHTRS